MNNLDLRQLGFIMGLPIYVDVASVRDTTPTKENPITERTRKTMIAGMMLKQAFDMSDEQFSEKANNPVDK